MFISDRLLQKSYDVLIFLYSSTAIYNTVIFVYKDS